jgi:hypothetical protein
MPKHSKDTNSYSMVVITNKRPDGRFQYKVTLPKKLGDTAMSVRESVSGEFTLSNIGYGKDDPTVVFRLDRFSNPSEPTQKHLVEAEWDKLSCPFCGEVADPPIFPEGTDPISHKLTHECGATYYADRSDVRTQREWNGIKGTGKDWKIVHNYHVQFGRVASDLPPDFDVKDSDDRLVHVLFLKPSIL